MTLSNIATIHWRVARFALLAVACAGCTDSALRLQSPETLESVVDDVRLVRDVTVPFGGHPLKVESIVLVGNLPGTGSDPAPSSERAVLVDDMLKREVENPNRVLASPSTSLAIASATLRPGLRKGDRLDVEVFLPSRSDTTSLRDGVTYETRLRENKVLGGRRREGKVLALAKGPVLVDPLAPPDSPELRRGRMLGGGVALQSRPIGLLLKPDDKDVRTSAQVGTAINRRFHLTTRGIKSGVANPKTEAYVELQLHPRYKDNVERYLQIIASIPLQESTSEQQMRFRLLERQLLDPISAASAALRLEAIGPDSAEVLKSGLASADAEVRFYAAEALAYLDDPAAAATLGEAARNQPAFRAYAFTALSSMDEPTARDELVKLLDVKSAETRYGAFRAPWAMNPHDPVIRGENLGERFSYHVLKSQGPPMIHVTRSFRTELVLFGSGQKLQLPLILDAGKNIRVNAGPQGSVVVTRFTPGKSDDRREVSAKVDDVIRAIVDLGGSYPDVVQALSQAKASKSLLCRLEVDAIPRRDRKYYPSDKLADATEVELAGYTVESPQPNLYSEDGDDRRQKPESATADPGNAAGAEPTAKRRGWPLTRYVGRMWDWRKR